MRTVITVKHYRSQHVNQPTVILFLFNNQLFKVSTALNHVLMIKLTRISRKRQNIHANKQTNKQKIQFYSNLLWNITMGSRHLKLCTEIMIRQNMNIY